MKYFTLLLTLLVSLSALSKGKETRKRIAVIDTGVASWMKDKPYMCKDMAQVSLDGSPEDWHGHGTNVVGLIAENMDSSKYCITMYKFDRKQKFTDYVKLLTILYYDSPVGVNLSLGGEARSMAEYVMLKALIYSGARIIAAAGNDYNNLDEDCYYYPACYGRVLDIIVVGNFTSDASNKGSVVDLWLDGTNKGYPAMTGTSQATAIATGLYFSK